MTPFSVAVLLHLVADWVLQNDWMALNKSDLRHPAGWVHGAIHAVLMLFVFPPFIALVVGLTHILIDTRAPATAWMRFYKGKAEGPYKTHVAVWLDQVFHMIVLTIAVMVMT